ncbi:MAG: DUF6886 family protein [Thermomicrobiales bacterium]
MNLYHFSEDPAITRFAPRPSPIHPDQPPLVWAIAETHAAHYSLPRDCPRVICWPDEATTPADRARVLGATNTKVLAVERDWLRRIADACLYAYQLPGATFTSFDTIAGYYVSRVAVTPLAVEPLDHLLERIAAAGIEVRVMPSLWPLYHAVVNSTLQFSIIRMRNARPEGEA